MADLHTRLVAKIRSNSAIARHSRRVANVFQRRNASETRVRYAGPMIRSLFGLPAVVADYTFGTVIVLVQLAIKGRMEAREQH